MTDDRTRPRELVRTLTPESLREVAQEEDAEGEFKKQYARALFALADLLDPAVPDSGIPRRAEPSQARPAPTARRTTRRRPPAAPASNKRPLAQALIDGRPTPGWTPAEVRDALVEGGEIPGDTSGAAIRVMLRRMADAGDLVKTPDGRYTAPRPADATEFGGPSSASHNSPGESDGSSFES